MGLIYADAYVTSFPGSSQTFVSYYTIQYVTKKNKHTTAELEPGHILSTKEHKYQYLYITPEINIYALYYSKTDTAAVHLLHNMASTH